MDNLPQRVAKALIRERRPTIITLWGTIPAVGPALRGTGVKQHSRNF